MRADDVIAELRGRGYYYDGQRLYSSAAICHEPSRQHRPALQIKDGPNGWWAYCYACARKVTVEVAKVIGTEFNRGGALAPPRYDAATHTSAGAAAYYQDKYGVQAVVGCALCGAEGKMRRNYRGDAVCEDGLACIERGGIVQIGLAA